MFRFAQLICLAGVLAASATALADDVPQAKCPDAESTDKDKACPPPTNVPTTADDTTQAPADPAPVEPVDPAPVQAAPVQPVPPPAPAAQVDVNITTPTVTTEPVYVSPTYVRESTLERWGIGVAIGGGVSGFTNETMRDTSNDGGNWDVRVSVGLRLPVAFEGSYIGSAQGIDALGLDSNAVLIGNGVQGALRVNLLDYNIQPFLFGGVAWRRYQLANENFNTSDVASRDDVLEVPMGAGLAWKYRGAMLDLRGEFRYASREDMVPKFNGTGEHVDMHRYGATANLGFAF